MNPDGLPGPARSAARVLMTISLSVAGVGLLLALGVFAVAASQPHDGWHGAIVSVIALLVAVVALTIAGAAALATAGVSVLVALRDKGPIALTAGVVVAGGCLYGAARLVHWL
jgi:hypothetical protein